MPFAGDATPFSTAVTVTVRQKGATDLQKGLTEVTKGVTDTKKAVTATQTGLTETPMAETTLPMAFAEPKIADSPDETGALAIIQAAG